MDKVELGKKLREARNKAGLTQEALAEKAEVGVMYLGEIERGVKMPSMKIFIKIIIALDISADYILRDELPSGREYVLDDVTEKLSKLTPQQRKGAVEILDAYIKTLKD